MGIVSFVVFGGRENLKGVFVEYVIRIFLEIVIFLCSILMVNWYM